MIPSASFTAAWTTAAERLNKATDEITWKIYEVAANQAKYPSVPSSILPFPTSLKQPLPDFDAALQQDVTSLETMKERYLATFTDSLELDLTLENEARIRNYYGALLGQNDDYTRARTQFRTILAKDSTYASAWHNWGNVEFVLGNFAKAESLYVTALAHNPFSRGTYLNLAILYQMMMSGGPEDSVYYQQKSEDALLKAAQLLEGDAEGAFAILGFAEERTDGKAESFIDKVKEKIRKVKRFVDTSFKKYVRRKEIRGVALDRHGTKGWGELDQDRGELLAWSY
jgi:tetratricopeptide (TPR) repeat protein